jgi:hypothetical protein
MLRNRCEILLAKNFDFNLLNAPILKKLTKNNDPL